jgi:hypothetical protein
MFYETALETIKVVARDLSGAINIISEKPHNNIARLDVGLLFSEEPEPG